VLEDRADTFGEHRSAGVARKPRQSLQAAAKQYYSTIS
jgi:hypothetical protein